MPKVPANPKIYHITHLKNLSQIIENDFLWSDAKRIELDLDCEVVGMSEIKRRRLNELAVECYPTTKVGEYVPFYFCPRSIMLYLLYMGNHPDLAYQGGQDKIIHLEADLHTVVAWAKTPRRKWVFTDCNAGARYALFFNSLSDLDKINWVAVDATDFRDPKIHNDKQAELLLYESFPWFLVERIGVINSSVLKRVNDLLGGEDHKPIVSVEPTWYFP